MAEDLQIASGTKAEQYEALLPQIRGACWMERRI